MKRTWVMFAVAVGLGVSLVASAVLAQAMPRPPRTPEGQPAAVPAAPAVAPAAPRPAERPAPAAPARVVYSAQACGICQTAKSAGGQAALEPAKKAGLTDAMIMSCCMLSDAKVGGNDAAALLAVKDMLKLNDDQVKKLQAIVDKARTDAAAVLTDDQKKQVQGVAEQSMADLDVKLTPIMTKMMEAEVKGAPAPAAPAAAAPAAGAPAAPGAPGAPVRPPRTPDAGR